jgi:hypothetical protein
MNGFLERFIALLGDESLKFYHKRYRKDVVDARRNLLRIEETWERLDLEMEKRGLK